MVDSTRQGRRVFGEPWARFGKLFSGTGGVWCWGKGEDMEKIRKGEDFSRI